MMKNYIYNELLFMHMNLMLYTIDIQEIELFLETFVWNLMLLMPLK